MKNRILFLSSLFVVLSPSVAIAGESDWSGPYVGVYTGLNNSTTSGRDYWCWMVCSIPTLSSTDAAIGATAGVNIQVEDSLILGIEADIGSGGTASAHIISAASGLAPEYDWQTRIRKQATVRGRAGVGNKHTMAYVTAGAGFADYSVSAHAGPASWKDGTPGVNWGSNWHGTVPGIVYGAGVEHRVGKLSFKFEVLRSEFGARGGCNMDFEGPTAGQCWNSTRTAYPPAYSPSVTSVRVGANFHF